MRQYVGLIHKEVASDYGVSFPDLAGVVTAGASVDEAREFAEQALAFHVEGLIDDGDAVPEPTSLEQVMAVADNRDLTTIMVPLRTRRRVTAGSRPFRFGNHGVQLPGNPDSLREPACRRSAAMRPHLALPPPLSNPWGFRGVLVMTMKKAILAVLMTAALAGCETQTEGQQRATTGALIGGAGGALVGQAIGGNTKSTVIGAASGALLGAVVGSATTPQRRGDQLCRYQDRYGRIYTAPCDDRYYNGNY